MFLEEFFFVWRLGLRERMVGALSVVGSSVMESHTGPCLCVDALPTTTSVNLKSGGDVVLCKNLMGRKHLLKHGVGTMKLSSSFIDPGREWRVFVSRSCKRQRKDRRVAIVNELGGQYEESFEDVKTVTCLMYLLVLDLIFYCMFGSKFVKLSSNEFPFTN